MRFFYARSFEIITGGTVQYYREKIGTADYGTIEGVQGNSSATYYTAETGNTQVKWTNNNYFETPDQWNRYLLGTADYGILSGVTGDGDTYYFTTQDGNTRVYWTNNRFQTNSYNRYNLGIAVNGTITGVEGNNDTNYYTSEDGNSRVYWRNGKFRNGRNNNSPEYNGPVFERTYRWTGEVWERTRKWTGEVWEYKETQVGGESQTRIQVNNNDSGYKYHQTGTVEAALTFVNDTDSDDRGPGNDYNRDKFGGSSYTHAQKTNTWKTVEGITNPESLIDSNYYASSFITGKGFETYDNVHTWVITREVDIVGKNDLPSSYYEEKYLPMKYYYFDIALPYGYSLKDVWPTIGSNGVFADAYLSAYNHISKSLKTPSNPNGEENAFLTTFYWITWKGPSEEGAGLSGTPSELTNVISSFRSAPNRAAGNSDGGYANFMLYWRNELTKTYLYRIHYSALSNETGVSVNTTGYRDSDNNAVTISGSFVEQTDMQFLVSGDRPSYSYISDPSLSGVTPIGRVPTDNAPMTVTINGTEVTVDGTIDLYCERNKHNISFLPYGEHINIPEGGGTLQVDVGVNIPYGESISGVIANSDYVDYVANPDVTNPEIAEEGYYFDGWYEDPSCKIPADFSKTMPDKEMVYYGKWTTYRVRVVLIPTTNDAHNDEVTFTNNQALTFRVDYGEEIYDTNINAANARRPGYVLRGWYYIDQETGEYKPFSFEDGANVIVNGNPAVNMDYQNTSDWTRTEEYPKGRYADNDGKHDNVKGIIKLYALWDPSTEDRVYVEYVVPEEYCNKNSAGYITTTVPVDNERYQGDTFTIAEIGEKPENYKGDYEFTNWVLLKEDGTPSDITRTPNEYLEIDNTGETKYIQLRPLYDNDNNPIVDENDEPVCIKVVVLQAQFRIADESATSLTYNSNFGTTPATIEKKVQINGNVTLLGEGAFTRDGYELIGWSLSSSISAEDFATLLKAKDDNTPIDPINGVETKHVFALGEEVIIDNLTRDALNTNANTLYAIWRPGFTTITIAKEGMADDGAALFLVNGEGYTNLEVAVPNDSSVTIANCRIEGVYTITEVDGWTWNYTIANVSGDDDTETDGYQIVVDVDATKNVITFTNEKSIDKWLTDMTTKVNALIPGSTNPVVIWPEPSDDTK